MRRLGSCTWGLAAGLALFSCGVEDIELTAGGAGSVTQENDGAVTDVDATVAAPDGAATGPDAPGADGSGAALGDATRAIDATFADATPAIDATFVDGRMDLADSEPIVDSTAPPASDAAVPDSSACGDAPAPTGCRALGDPCGSGPDCCSDHCAAGACVVPGTCFGAGAMCASAADCCSSLCEPVNGTATERTCLAECRPNGMACTRASDCCTLACNGGVCGGTECFVENTDCTANAQCCSNECDTTNGNRCVLDPSATCRPSGEDCTSGGGQKCCGVCDNTLKRCDPGPSACRVTEMICTVDTDCCSGMCADDGTGRTICVLPAGASCLAAGAACHATFECCTGTTCTGDPPACGSAPSTCGITGASCTVGGACCSSECSGGSCQAGCVAPAL